MDELNPLNYSSVFGLKDLLYNNPDEVFKSIELSQKDKKHSLLIYFGVDWCLPSRWMMQDIREICDDPEFSGVIKLHVANGSDKKYEKFYDDMNMISGTPALIVFYKGAVIPFSKGPGSASPIHKVPLNAKQLRYLLQQISGSVRDQDFVQLDIATLPD